jgi:hypothetical protein
MYLPKLGRLEGKIEEMQFSDLEFKLARAAPPRPDRMNAHTLENLEMWFAIKNKKMATCADLYKYFKEVLRTDDTEMKNLIKSDLDRLIYTNTKVIISDDVEINHNGTEIKEPISVFKNLINRARETTIKIHEGCTTFLQAFLDTKDSLEEIRTVFSKIGDVGSENVNLSYFSTGTSAAGFFMSKNQISIAGGLNTDYGGYAYEVLK